MQKALTAAPASAAARRPSDKISKFPAAMSMRNPTEEPESAAVSTLQAIVFISAAGISKLSAERISETLR